MSTRTLYTRLISRLKNTLATKRRIKIVYVWYSELVIGVVLLVVAVGFNWRAYQSFVAAPPELPTEEIQKVVVLDERAVKEAAETIARHTAFLEYPTFPPLIQNPF